MNYLGKFIVDQKIDFDLGETMLEGSAFLPTLSEVNSAYFLEGNYKIQLTYDSSYPHDELFHPYVYGGKCDFDFSPQITMPEMALNASLIYLMYEGMQDFWGREVDQMGFSQPIVNCDATSLYNNFAPMMQETNTVRIVDRSGTLPDQFSSYKLEGINLKTQKINTVMQDGELRSPTAVRIKSIGGTSYSYNPDTIYNFLDARDNIQKEISPNGSTGISILHNVVIEAEYQTWEAVVGYVTQSTDIICDLIFSMEFKFDFYEFGFNCFNLNDALNVDIFSVGNQQVTESVLKVINFNSINSFKAVFYFPENGSGILLKYKDGIKIDERIIGLLDPTAYQTLAGIKYGIFNFGGGAMSNSEIGITRQSLEAIEPIVNGDNQTVLNLDGTRQDYVGAVLATYPDHTTSYTAIVGSQKDGVSQVYFCLMDGTGYYDLDLTDIVPLNGSVEYASYAMGVLTLGYLPDLADYPDPFTNPPPLKYVMLNFIPVPAPVKKVELDYRKFIISFMPCYTHCMAKGGIISKVY